MTPIVILSLDLFFDRLSCLALVAIPCDAHTFPVFKNRFYFSFVYFFHIHPFISFSSTLNTHIRTTANSPFCLPFISRLSHYVQSAKCIIFLLLPTILKRCKQVNYNLSFRNFFNILRQSIQIVLYQFTLIQTWSYPFNFACKLSIPFSILQSAL